MKFATLFALVASASAIKLQFTTPKPKFVTLNLVSEWECPTQEQEDEIKAWVEDKLTTGDKKISAKEAKQGLEDFAEKHGFEITDEMAAQAVARFNYVDTNDDGHLDAKEIDAVIKKHKADYEVHCG